MILILSIANAAATNPYSCIAFTLSLSGAMLTAGLYTDFKLDLDLIHIFTPTTSLTMGQREWALQGSGLQGYVATHVPMQIIIHAQGDNVMTYEGIERAFQMYELTNSIGGLDEICGRNENSNTDMQRVQTNYFTECDVQSVTRFWDHNRTAFQEMVPVNDDNVTRFLLNNTYPDGTTVDYDMIFGSLQTRDDGIPESATALFVTVEVPLSRLGSRKQLYDYSDRLLSNVTAIRQSWASQSSDYRVEFAFNYRIDQEFLSTILSDLPILPIAFSLMLAFMCCIFWRRHRVQSRLLLAFGSVVTVVASMATSFGIMFIFGVPFTVVTNLLPYIVFGIGLDDTFIIHGAYLRTNPNQPTEHRIRETFQEVGLSIAMTTMTTSIALALGIISTVPAIRYLCIYAAPTVLIDGLYQISLFVSFIVLDERRIKANRMDCCPCVVTTSKYEYYDDDDDLRLEEDDKMSVDKVSVSTYEGSSSSSSNPPQKRRTCMSWYADLLLRLPVKIAVLVTFAGIFVGLAYSATFLRQDFSFFDLLPSNSSTRSYLVSLEEYGGHNGEINVYFRDINQSDPDVQVQMIDYLDQIIALDHVELMPFCWVRDFRALLTDPEGLIEKVTNDPSTARIVERYPAFAEALRNQGHLLDKLTPNQVLDLVLAHPIGKLLYEPHIRRDPNTGNVIISRCKVTIENLDYSSVKDRVNLLNAQNEVTETHPINQGADEYRAFLYKDLFHLWEFFDVAIAELKYTAFVGIITVTVCALVFVPHWTAITYVFPLMCILYVNLLGLFNLVGLTLNVLTYVVLVVSVGLLVDFLMHVLLRYYESTMTTRDERVKDTLETMGSSILLGGISTFLGSVPLVFSESMVFQTVCIAFFCMITLGVVTGLVLLPVLLSIFGCEPTSKDDVQLKNMSSLSYSWKVPSPKNATQFTIASNSSGTFPPPILTNDSSEHVNIEEAVQTAVQHDITSNQKQHAQQDNIILSNHQHNMTADQHGIQCSQTQNEIPPRSLWGIALRWCGGWQLIFQ
ncbi:Pick C1-like protein 1 [Seminavis robusta]|uniref:Pick C1-like protein 1 n=1 Tax=Seminavis robusta TaxID=568900 RepID=A0A9N8ESD8_9STRA|nr:Pick C1-like protein 1 [Seminavis robusta]|eukprot:Sro1807_g298970.1 Pick C1-like protein 1 (1018) ;mRNA; f:17572-21064